MTALSLALATLAILAAQDMPAAPAGTLLVLNKSDDTLWFVDPADGTRRAEVPTGRGPHEVAVSPDGKTAVVADYGEQQPGQTLTVVDLLAGRVLRTIDLAPHQRPHGVAWLPDGRHVAVTSETSGALLLVDVQESRVAAELPTAQPVSHMVALSPDASRAYVANIGGGSLSVFDLAKRERLAVVPTGAGAEGLDVTPDGRWILVANREADTLSFIDAKSLEEAAEVATGDFPIRVKVTPDGKRALVSCAQSGDVAVLDLAERKEVARVAVGAAPSEGTEQAPVPVGILVEPGGARAFVAATNANIVLVLDLKTLKVSARFATGKQPDGLGWTALVAPLSAPPAPPP
jgi:YVTN family beta-propeller protein